MSKLMEELRKTLKAAAEKENPEGLFEAFGESMDEKALAKKVTKIVDEYGNKDSNLINIMLVASESADSFVEFHILLKHLLASTSLHLDYARIFIKLCCSNKWGSTNLLLKHAVGNKENIDKFKELGLIHPIDIIAFSLDHSEDILQFSHLIAVLLPAAARELEAKGIIDADLDKNKVLMEMMKKTKFKA